MRIRSPLAFALCALPLAAGAAAEPPAEPAPAVLARPTLSLDAARRVIAAAEAEAARRGVGVVTAVVDPGGALIALSRMDAAQVASVEVGVGKARTAAIFRRPSRAFEEQVAKGRVAALALPGATALQGGIPIAVDGVVAGAVGVSGDTPQTDEDIAIAAARALAPAAAPVANR